jgi:hypothetical protein
MRAVAERSVSWFVESKYPFHWADPGIRKMKGDFFMSTPKNRRKRPPDLIDAALALGAVAGLVVFLVAVTEPTKTKGGGQ